MANRRNRQTRNERLDRAGAALTRAAAASDEAFEAAAAAPFLYARVRARIAAEQAARRTDADDGWLALLTIARRAVPALTAFAALIFTLMLWLASGSTPAATGFGDEAFYGTGEAGVEQAVLTDTNSLTRDEVLSLVVSREAQVRR